MSAAIPLQRWRKLGRIFDPQAHSWAGSHAQGPTVLVLPDRLRVYYADRTSAGRSFPTFLDVAIDDPTQVLSHHRRPVLGLGVPGTFDDEGVMPAHVFAHEGRVWMYYSGWNRRLTVPYHNATGLAFSDDQGLTFRRAFDGPVLDRTPAEPYIAVTPFVVPGAGGEPWRAWYVSGVRWVAVGEKHEPVYVIKYAESDDGIAWRRDNLVSVEPRDEREAFSHPSVLRLGGRFHLWYCSRGSEDFRDGGGSYRIGYAVSADGRRFERHDSAAGMAPSASGWDDKMMAYPAVVQTGVHTYMFHNGNSFGRTGIGVARLENPEALDGRAVASPVVPTTSRGELADGT